MSSLTLVSDRVVRQLADLAVVVPQPAEVRDFLICNADIADVVVRGAEAARREFGTTTQLSLEIYRDPDLDDSYPVLYVRQETYDLAIFDRIDKVRTAYERRLSGKSGWFVVTTDLSLPRKVDGL